MLLPSLAYGAEVAWEGAGRDRYAFLREWAAEHFDADPEAVVDVVEGVARACRVRPPAEVLDLLEYREHPDVGEGIREVERALAVCDGAAPKTRTARDYLAAARMMLSRAAHRLRLKRSVNRLAAGVTARSAAGIKDALAGLEALKDELPKLIEAEKDLWHAHRYEEDPCFGADIWEREDRQLERLIPDIRSAVKGSEIDDGFLPAMLELTIMNPSPAWQYLTLAVAGEDGQWIEAHEGAECTMMTVRDRQFIRLPIRDVRQVRFTLGGFGDLRLAFCEVRLPGRRFVPERLVSSSGLVANPDCIIGDDLRFTTLGSNEVEGYLSRAVEQPSCSLTIELREDEDFPRGRKGEWT